MKRFYLIMEQYMKESISNDPMAAVLVAHIKDPDMDEIGVIVNYLCKGGSFTIDDLKYILGDTIKLKSASPDALQNLYNNLQKIQR